MCLSIGCATNLESQFLTRSTLEGEALVSHYGTVQAVEIQNLFHSIVNRILARDPLASNIEVIVLQTKEPLAFASGENLILLSRGILHAVHHEAELAFVIAHEIAHLKLRHTAQPKIDPLMEESAADAYAVELLERGGYPSCVAINSIWHAMQYSVRVLEVAEEQESCLFHARARLSALSANPSMRRLCPLGSSSRQFAKALSIL